MKSVSTRLDDETYRLIAETADERGVSKAEVLRELVEKGRQYDELRRERDRLRAEKRTLINQREEHSELVEYVQEERELQRGRRDLDRTLKEANILMRWKWKLTGIPADLNEE